MSKKIIHIINGLELGGAETALYRLLQTFSHSDDYEFFVIALHERGYYSSFIEQLGIPIHYLGIKKNNIIKPIYHLHLLMRRIKPDIVQTWLYHSDFIGGLIAKLHGVKKIIWGIRCEGTHLKKTTQWIKKLCALLSWVIPNIIITNSKTGANHHIKTGYQLKKMNVIYNGFDPLQFSNQENKTPLKKIGNKILPPNALLIGTLARFHDDKGYPNLIRAIDTICASNQNAYFVLCGQGCHIDNTLLQPLLNTLTYQDRVILINGLDDTPRYLNQLNIFILASKTEAFPNSLAEAMLCELPCITTDVGEAQEIIGDTGLIVPRQNSEKLASACLAMLEKSQNERQTLGALARKRITAQYSMTQHQAEIIAIYTS